MEQDRLEVVIAAQAQQATTAMKQLIANINQCSAAVTSLTSNFNNLGSSSLTGTTKGIKQVKTSTDKFEQSLKNTSKAMNTAFNVGKMYLVWNVTKRLRQTLWNCVELSLDFLETTNKFEVSMGNMTDRAYGFQNALTTAFGVARTDMMEFQATFNNIMSAIPRINRRSFIWCF